MDRDNHAGKINFLSYVGGFFDGEGYIGLGMQKTHGGKDRNILPTVRIVNTDEKPITFIAEGLSKLGIRLWCKPRGGIGFRKDGTKTKTIYELGIAGKTQIKEFIMLIRPYVLVKGEQLDVVMNFIESREKKMSGRRNRTGVGKAEYSEDEIASIEILKRLKH